MKPSTNTPTTAVVVVVDQKVDVVLDRHPGLVAARDDVAEPDAALAHEMLRDRVTEAAALGHERDGARGPRVHDVRAERRGAEADVEDAVAVRPAHEQAALGREALELVLARRPSGPASANPLDSTMAARTPRSTAPARTRRDLLGGNRHDHRVCGLGRRRQIRIAGQPEDVVVSRVDREDRPA